MHWVCDVQILTFNLYCFYLFKSILITKTYYTTETWFQSIFKSKGIYDPKYSDIFILIMNQTEFCLVHSQKESISIWSYPFRFKKKQKLKLTMGQFSLNLSRPRKYFSTF